MAGGPGLCKAKALRKHCCQAEGTRARRKARRLGAGRWGGYFLSCAASARAALESVPTGAEQSPAGDKPPPHDSPSPSRCSLRERLTVCEECGHNHQIPSQAPRTAHEILTTAPQFVFNAWSVSPTHTNYLKILLISKQDMHLGQVLPS